MKRNSGLRNPFPKGRHPWWPCVVLGLVACSDAAERADGGVLARDAAVVGDAAPARDAAAPAGDAAIDADAAARPVDAAAADDAAVADAAPTRDATATPGDVPRAVEIARTTTIPACTVFVDGASAAAADGTAARPYTTLAAAVAAAAPAAVVCVAEGTYREALRPGDKPLTLAGGFQSGQAFAVRDSARFVTRAQGDGTNTLLLLEDPTPRGSELTAVDGFEITGYAQAIVRDVWYSQRFDLTHNDIHDNACAGTDQVGGAFLLGNVSGTIGGNVLARNRCGRGGGGAVADSTDENVVRVVGNRVDGNVGDEPGISHGGGLYLFANSLTVVGNSFTGNTATGWGGGLYVGAVTGGGQHTTAQLAWNVYRDNRAGGAGGGFFCDDSARCTSEHEIYDGNCGGNVYVDSGPDGTDPTVARFDHMTNHRGLEVGCGAPGAGLVVTKNNLAADAYTITNSIFWGHAPGNDLAASCGSGCDRLTVDVRYSLVDTTYANDGVTVVFGAGIVAPVDPLFVDAARGDFHLRSTRGHWAAAGYVSDPADSPALARGDPGSPNTDAPERSGARAELGAYGNSAEASYVR